MRFMTFATRLASILLLVLTALLAGCGRGEDPMQAFNAGDYGKSLALWLPRAEKGDAAAQNYVGIQYHLGLGVPHDYTEAVKWYQRAADNGNSDAQRNLGAMYYGGLGVPHNNNCAYAWYYVASQNGNAKGEEARLSMANELTPNKTRIMENWIRAYLKGKPGELKAAGNGSSEYERVQVDLSPKDMQCSSNFGTAAHAAQDPANPSS